MRIILTGGGTGGHIFPLIAVARKLRMLGHERGVQDIQFLYVGPRFDAVVEEIFRREGIATRYIAASKLRRYFSFANIVDAVKFPFVMLHAVWVLLWNMPDAVFSKGGFGSFPVVFASWLFAVPSRVIHDSDAAPGLANRMAARFAKRIGVAFAAAIVKFPVEKTAVVGLPVREDLGTADRQKAKKFFEIFSDRKTVLIIGGSLGARSMNNAVAPMLPKLCAQYEVIHIIGQRLYDEYMKTVANLAPNVKTHYHPYSFLTEELSFAFSLADIVVSRAGASGIFEIASCGKPSILIPRPRSPQDHNRKNAYEYAKSGATVVIEEDNLTPNLLLSNIVTILEDKASRDAMSSSASAFFIKDSAEIIAKEILELRGVV